MSWYYFPHSLMTVDAYIHQTELSDF